MNSGQLTGNTGQGGVLCQMQQTINDLCQAVEEHASREEIILNMMKKSLEAK
jgi:hypothetical protein